MDKILKEKKNQNSLFRPGDLILILILFFCALGTLAFVRLHVNEGRRVCVRIDGEVYGEYPLDEDREIVLGDDISDTSGDAASVTSEDDASGTSGDAAGTWHNTLVIRDGQADMTDADCPDRICVNHRPVSKEGETIVCLPHKVVVEVN